MPREMLRPVQVLLETKRFIESPEPRQQGGGNRDFFQNDNRGFAQHKLHILARLESATMALRDAPTPLGFLLVQMREEALAKSYRPIGSLFTESHGFALAGSGGIGEMVFQATPRALERLYRIIEVKAELSPREVRNETSDEIEKRASGYRSEVGAISDLRLHDQSDRLSFSAEEAIEWLSQPNTLGGYVVELFRPRTDLALHAVSLATDQLRTSLTQLRGVAARPFLPRTQTAAFGEPPLALSVQLFPDGESRIALPFNPDGEPQQASSTTRSDIGERIDPDFTVDRHMQLLSVLKEQSLVRSIDLPPLIEASPVATFSGVLDQPIPGSEPDTEYPVVGIVDGGVAKLTPLASWRVGDAGLVPNPHRDEGHGTFIAGLIAAGSTLNPDLAHAIEPDGCKFYDLDIFPQRSVRPAYYSDPEFFFDLLDEKIKVAKRDFGARIFNFSFGLHFRKERFDYSPIADRFDRLARSNDVVLIVSAGNLPSGAGRPPWPSSPASTVQMLAAFGAREGAITPPAEHLLGLTVGAINPPNIKGHIVDMPTTYTRRGPGVGGARKPDLSHYGGVDSTATTGNQTGLISLSPTGEAVQKCGTSFAAPSVAATVATIDHRLGKTAPRELLLALPIHRAVRPKALQHKSLKHISREFVGFGLAPPADVILVDDPYAITLVFSETLLARQVLTFPFTWPHSMVTKDGGCRGRIDLTLAYTPPIDPDHKQEALRVQLEAYMRQEILNQQTGKSTWDSQLTHDGAGVPQGMNKTEKYMITTGLKWSPIKRYYANMRRGRGNTSNWQLGLDSSMRAGAHFPSGGVPFTILLTISDPRRLAAIHDEIRNQLQATGLTIADITVAHRVRQRGG